MTPPRDNVLFVPDRNVLLTKSGWGDERTRSSPYDVAGQRPAGSAAKGREEADWARAGGQGVERHCAADPAITKSTEERRRQGGHTPVARPAVESQDQRKDTREDRAYFVRGDLSGFWAHAGQRISGQKTRHSDRSRSVTASNDFRQPLACPRPEGRGGAS